MKQAKIMVFHHRMVAEGKKSMENKWPHRVAGQEVLLGSSLGPHRGLTKFIHHDELPTMRSWRRNQPLGVAFEFAGT